MLSFRKERKRRYFLNPFNNFEKGPYEIEVRFDPLTSHTAVFNPLLEDKIRLFFGPQDWELVKSVAEATKDHCFMCPEKVRNVTPRYPDEIIPGGRLIKGECTLFPNLFPANLWHAVISVGEAHFRRLKEFHPRLIQDGLLLGLEFIKHIISKDKEALYGALCANYLPPAGASLVHPHFQAVISHEPSPQARIFLEASAKFYLLHSKNYWNLLIYEEEGGERYIGRFGRVVFLTSFAPMGNNEVIAIFESCDSIESITDEDISHLAQGLSAVLSGYESLGYGTFNFTFFLPPLQEKISWFRPHLRIITRQNFYENYRTDDYFLQRQLGQELILMPPEELAKELRQLFEELK